VLLARTHIVAMYVPPAAMRASHDGSLSRSHPPLDDETVWASEYVPEWAAAAERATLPPQ
jgi:hypothetical protein